MNLTNNSPAYFSDHYGVDDNVYRYCQKLSAYFKDKENSDTLSTIGIIPAAAPKELYGQGMWKESTRIWALGSCAAIHIRMDFERYYQADSNGKIELIKEMVIRAVKKVKAKGKFDWERFRDDLRREHSVMYDM